MALEDILANIRNQSLAQTADDRTVNRIGPVQLNRPKNLTALDRKYADPGYQQAISQLPEPVRQAIQQEIHHFVSDLANDFRLFPDMQNLPSSDLMMIAHLVINTAITLCGEILMVPADQTQLKYELGLQAVKQMRLIFVGAMHWQPEKGTQLSGRTAEVLSPGVAGPSA